MNINSIIMSFEAGEDLAYGDLVKINSDNEAVKVDSAEETKAVGIIYSGGSEGEQVSVLKEGVMDDVHLLVEDTDGSSGYDSAITHGAHLVISGKSDGTYDEGQALSASDGTGVSTADATTIVAKSLCAVDGSTSEDTFTTGKVYLKF